VYCVGVSAASQPAPDFRYDGFSSDPDSGLLTCRYSLGETRFVEQVRFAPDGRWDDPAVTEAARLVFLLAGVSYYKTAAPPVIDLGDTAVTDTERDFLLSFYTDGLGEFAYRNGLDLSGLRIEGPVRPAAAARRGTTQAPQPAVTGEGAATAAGGPLIPFGGGIDSIVTVEMVRRLASAGRVTGAGRAAGPALFIMSRPGNFFAAIEKPAAVTGLPIVRAERGIDPQLASDAASPVPIFLNGHVPVTGVLSAIAVLAAVLAGRDAVIMSNEWSASIATLEYRGRPVNHQYSKSAAFEAGFRTVLDDAFGGAMSYFSALRPRTELWVAQRFAGLTEYHSSFHSCNRAFYLDPDKRLDHWCGECDKCCFIDLILAPFLPAADLERIFGGREPLRTGAGDAAIAERFAALVGTSAASKPFECVGEVGECRAAAVLAAQRPDRAATALLQDLAAQLRGRPDLPAPGELLRPVGEHYIPDAYAAEDLLV